MDINDLLGKPQGPSPGVKITVWDKSQRVSGFIALASLSCLATQLARMLPPLAPVVGMLFGAAGLSLGAWAVLTPGDQRLAVALSAIALILGCSLGLHDAAEMLALMGVKHWVAGGAMALITIFVFASEGRSNAGKG